MPTFLVPRHVSAHRTSAIALYRALLSQSQAAPLPISRKTELQNIVRNRFKQTIHLHSYRRLKLAFQAGYEAIDRLDASLAGDETSTAYISSLIAQAPAKVKSTPPIPALPIRQPKKSKHDAPPPFKPSTELLSRPHPLSQLSGERHVPVLFNASNIPVLRIKKPQPQNLSGFIKRRLRQRQRRHDRKHWLKQQIEFGGYEDLWDELVERQGGEGVSVGRGRKGGGGGGEKEPSWADAFKDAMREVEYRIGLENKKNMAMARRMQEIVDREKELFERERAERKEVKRKERMQRRESEGAGT